MNSERTEKRDGKREPGPGSGSKRAYRKPELRVLGTVRELTLVSGTVNTTESVFPFSAKKQSP